MLTTSLAWVGHGSIGLGQSGADHTALISPIFCVRQRGLGFGALSNALQPVKAL
jgi:hypothetical protein